MNDKKSLYHISQEREAIVDALVNDEWTPELEQQLAINEYELKEKSLDYVHLLFRLHSELQLAKEAKERAQIHMQRREKAIEIIKQTLADTVTKHGVIKTDMYTIKTRKSEQVEITDVDAIPIEYAPYPKVMRKPDKIEIKKALKEGKIIPGACLKENHNVFIS